MNYTPSWLATKINPIIRNGSITGVYDRECNLSIWLQIASMTSVGSGVWMFTLPPVKREIWHPRYKEGIIEYFNQNNESIMVSSAIVEGKFVLAGYPIENLDRNYKIFVGFGDIANDV